MCRALSERSWQSQDFIVHSFTFFTLDDAIRSAKEHRSVLPFDFGSPVIHCFAPLRAQGTQCASNEDLVATVPDYLVSLLSFPSRLL